MHTINIVFSKFLSQYLCILYLVGLKNGYIFLCKIHWPKERNFTGHDSYTRRAYLKYVINLAIM